MSPGDVYSLFGNALDNAIEYLERISDQDKRLISVNVQARGSFIGVRIENYCGEELEFAEGLPLTKKPDKNYHGFGMKSIKYIVDKYGGSMLAERKDDMFILSIVFSKAES